MSFPTNIIAAAQASEKSWRVPASVSLAQWALESDYGSVLSGQNNPFGIKATQAQIDAGNARLVWTHETIKGAYIKVKQWFANFDNIDEAFNAHARLLATSPYYAKARAAKTPQGFTNALTGVYATGIPGHPYGAALIAIMDANNLYRFDEGAAAAPLVGSVAWVQSSLNALGARPALDVDGQAGPATRAAIAAFQQKARIFQDGIAGVQTVAALQAALAHKAA